MLEITSLYSCEKTDLHGVPYLETTLALSTGTTASSQTYLVDQPGIFALPQQADKDPFRFRGLGLTKPAECINDFFTPLLLNRVFKDQSEFDRLLSQVDSQPDSSTYGVNTTWSLSSAFFLASKGDKTLSDKPTQLAFSIINGGDLGGGNNLNWREIFLIPQYKTLNDQVQAAQTLSKELGFLLDQRSYVYSIGSYGGFTPDLPNHQASLILLEEAAKRCGQKTNVNLFLGINIGASPYLYRGKYMFYDHAKPIADETLCSYYLKLFDTYPIDFLIDPFSNDEWYSWSNLQRRTSKTIVGDDLLCSRLDRLQLAATKQAISGSVVHPVLCGTVSNYYAYCQSVKTTFTKLILPTGNALLSYPLFSMLAHFSQVDCLLVPSPSFFTSSLISIFS